MGSPLDLFSSAARDLDGHSYFLPPGFSTAFKLCYKFHTWKHHMKEVGSDPESATQYILCREFNKALGRGLIALPFEFLAKIAIIMRRFSECVQEFRQTCRAYNLLIKTIKELHFSNIHVGCPALFQKEIHPLYHFIDPATFRYLTLHSTLFFKKVVMIAKYTFYLFSQAFTLSMCTIQLTEAFLFTNEARNEAMDKLWLNLAKLAKDISENEEALLEDLEKNRKLTDWLLKFTKVSYTSDDLIHTAKRAIALVKKGNSLSNQMTTNIVNAVREVSSNISFTIFNTVPDFLKPGVEQEEHQTVPFYLRRQLVQIPVIKETTQITPRSLYEIQQRAQIAFATA